MNEIGQRSNYPPDDPRLAASEKMIPPNQEEINDTNACVAKEAHCTCGHVYSDVSAAWTAAGKARVGGNSAYAWKSRRLIQLEKR